MIRSIDLRQDQMDSLAPLFAEAEAAAELDKLGIIIGQVNENGTARFMFLENERATAVLIAANGKIKQPAKRRTDKK